MPAYLIYRAHVHDADAYRAYMARTPDAIAAFGGRFLARGGETVTLEGAPETARVIIVEFPSLDAAGTRLRPIMMTTLTTLFGLFPLVFLPREGTELYRGLGIVLLFGLLFSTVVTLSFTPCVLRLLPGGERRQAPA